MATPSELCRLLQQIRAYEPALAQQIQHEVEATDGVMTGERQELYGFDCYDDFIHHIMFCLALTAGHSSQHEVTLAYSDCIATDAALCKAYRFLELVREGQTFSTRST